MRYILFLFIVTEAYASVHSRPVEDFKGDNLVIGIGNYPYNLAQRVIAKDTEYSIDKNRRVYPCLIADGLMAQTYMDIQDNRFSCITFEHIGFSPYLINSHLTPTGNYKSIESGAYQPESWTTTNYDLAKQLFRILKPAGCLIFKSAVLSDRQDFIRMNLSIEDGAGTQAWKSYFETAGFVEVSIEMVYHKPLKGYYLQLNATKSNDLKKRK